MKSGNNLLKVLLLSPVIVITLWFTIGFVYMAIYLRGIDLEKVTAEVEGYPTVEKVLSIDDWERGAKQWIRRLELELEGDKPLTLTDIGPVVLVFDDVKGKYNSIRIAKIGGYDFDKHEYDYKDTDEFVGLHGVFASELESAIGHRLRSIRSIVEQHDAILAWFEETVEYARPRGQVMRGRPGSTGTTYLEDGSKKQDRVYGSDRRPVYDIDYDHDHGQGVPHIHLWGRPLDGEAPIYLSKEDRGEGLPLSPYYYRQYD